MLQQPFPMHAYRYLLISAVRHYSWDCRLLSKLDFPDMKFTLYFLGFHEAGDIPGDRRERVEWMFKQPATLELTHNW